MVRARAWWASFPTTYYAELLTYSTVARASINFYSPDDELLSRFLRHPNGTWILDEGSPGRSQFTGEALAVLQRKRAVRIFDHGWHLIPKALKHRPGVRRPVL